MYGKASDLFNFCTVSSWWQSSQAPSSYSDFSFCDLLCGVSSSSLFFYPTPVAQLGTWTLVYSGDIRAGMVVIVFLAIGFLVTGRISAPFCLAPCGGSAHVDSAYTGGYSIIYSSFVWNRSNICRWWSKQLNNRGTTYVAPFMPIIIAILIQLQMFIVYVLCPHCYGVLVR